MGAVLRFSMRMNWPPEETPAPNEGIGRHLVRVIVLTIVVIVIIGGVVVTNLVWS